MRTYLITVFLLAILCSCKNIDSNKSDEIEITKLPRICKQGGEPNLFISDEDIVYLSWVEYIDSVRMKLQYTSLEKATWLTPKTIATGDNWFVNWADFPSLVVYDKGRNLAAHWLVKSAEGTYDYDIQISQSNDSGHTWTKPFIPHKDGVAAEHGFVSMVPISDNKVFATWLDGRFTKLENEERDITSNQADHDGHEHQGSMTLRSATFDSNGILSEEHEIDRKVCDCCQTSAAITNEGPIVVYRDRSDEEIRDIYIARFINGKWLTPKPVFNDEWKIEGCPVNGPVVKAKDNLVAVVWYGVVNEEPQVKVAFSNDGGKNFELPIHIDNGSPIGRVDLILINEEKAFVSWMEEFENESHIKIAEVSKVNGKVNEWIVATANSSRQSGFPRMVSSENKIIVAWTGVDSIEYVETAMIDFANLF